MKTYVVSISGASASGKSTFSEGLQQRLSEYHVKLIHMDAYYKEESDRPRMTGVSDGKEYIDDNHPMCMDLDLCVADIQKAMESGCDVLLIEGIFALWDLRILSISDLKIFVDCDADVRFARRVNRNLSYGQKLEEIMSRYAQAVQPRQREFVEPAKWKADLILNGMANSALDLEIVSCWIRSQINK